MLRRPLRTLICLVVGTLLLAGCSGSHGMLRSEESAAVQPFGAPDLPMFPEAREKNRIGSEFFARYYLIMINAAIMSDSGPMRKLSRDCRACEALADAMDAMRARRDTTRMRRLVSLDSMSMGAIHGHAAVKVTFHFVQLPSTTVGRGSPTEQVSSASEHFEGLIEMSWDDADRQWAVTDLGSDRASK